jgi:uncharacterized protein YeeX (DUF496 family)
MDPQPQFRDKRVPWAQLEDYIKLHKKTIGSYMDLLQADSMDKEEIEAKLPKAFWQIHEMIAKILKENNIVPNQEEVKGGNQLQVIVKTVMKLQSTLIANNGMNKQDIKSIIMSMKPEIENSFDASMQQEVSRLLENLGGMTDMIESNFSQIKQTLQEFKDDIITSVT